MKRSANAAWKGNLKEGTGTFGVASGAIVDQRYSWKTRFGDAPGTNPEELIAAAHASCFTMALSFQLTNNKTVPTELKTLATVSMEKQDIGWTITQIHLDVTGSVPGVDAAKFDELAKTAKQGCPISRALNAVPISMTAKLV
jgi:osmotically inducible protein OsmC